MQGPELIGISKSMQRVKELIQHIAPTGLNVLITGESGVGKEIVTLHLYQASPRNGKPFVKVNCAAMPEGLLESELFGHEKGAFTGAERKRKGKFELAHRGLLFLDEVGDLPLNLQSKLLRVLQSGEFSSLGSEQDKSVDVWIIAATNNDLKGKIKKGSFREDLYYRLNTINIHIPPLRERPDDIPPLVEYYARQYSPLFNNKIFEIDDMFIKKLQAYDWPGNVRELQNVLKRFFVLGKPGDKIDKFIEEVKQETGKELSNQREKSLIEIILGTTLADQTDLSMFSLKKIRKKTLEKVEKEVITHVLETIGWNRTKASKILEVSYKTLLTRMNELNIRKKKT